MTFGQAISYNFSNLSNFEGRAGRSEFWWWALFVLVIGFVINPAAGGVGVVLGDSEFGFLTLMGYVFWAILVLATIAVGARRLHDTGKSGWLQLLWFLPCVGWIIMIVLWAQPGAPGDNAYGAASAS
ncbi:MAG: DUF805 domain-containing protein [Candidatus Nanopelagicales bacterium]|nr:DUF805 domain-containing protein [Candidatus Nanopelagicales bacterium]MCF8538551.1 DUF805 domain-containing protein [Candidatus Nanopelagicales bacterium]MCF8557861.1 DUF805 domain-containing protein [Candidatus Nanopelagicales bacterium]